MLIDNLIAAVCRETKQGAALDSDLCFHAGFSSQNSLGKCCWNSAERFTIPLFLLHLLLCS